MNVAVATVATFAGRPATSRPAATATTTGTCGPVRTITGCRSSSTSPAALTGVAGATKSRGTPACLPVEERRRTCYRW